MELTTEIGRRIPEKTQRTKLHSIGAPRAVANTERENPVSVAVFVMLLEDGSYYVAITDVIL